MRRFKVTIETGIVGGNFEEEFEVEDDATDEEIAAEAKDIFMNQCNYGFSEITDED
ncbi:hypothetical protein GHU73_12165 [Citrobacter werkmanii]|nr:hypothetical protein [Citrobacter werkmanii]EIS7448080.1 hypothetical protein [Citrobacter youngae]MBJ9598095.1 hypothetical protein [Citrobacter werkmanii]